MFSFLKVQKFKNLDLFLQKCVLIKNILDNIIKIVNIHKILQLQLVIIVVSEMKIIKNLKIKNKIKIKIIINKI